MLKKCEFCNTNLKKITESFLRCPSCDVVFNNRYTSASYEDSYFEVEYRQQYGKTYIEDKSNLQYKMQQRLNIFNRICDMPITGKSLLEIGSAAGFFIELAKNMGFNATGWEVSKYMSDYANLNGNKTITGDFQSLLVKNKDSKFNVISAFYVVEHFPDQKIIWESLGRILYPGGYLLLALPCISGPLFKFHRKKWFETHPVDHYIDYSHSGIKKISSMSGFKLLHMEAEGLHPDRFPCGNLPGFRTFFKKIQEKLAYSDTIYAVFQKL